MGSVLLPLASSVDSRASDQVGQWPIYHGDARHSGLSIYDASGNQGQLLWTFKTNSSVSSPLIDAKGNTYFMSTEFYKDGYHHILYSLNRNASLRWKTVISDEWGTDNLRDAYLALGPDGKIYVCHGNLYAIDPNGSVEWTYDGDGYHDGDGYPADFDFSPTIGPDGTIYVIAANLLWALHPSGKLKWSFDAEELLRNSPTISPDGTIFISSEGSGDPSQSMSYLFALDDSGHLKWKLATYANMITQPVVGKDGTIYYSTSDNLAYKGDSDKVLFAIASNGSMKWRFTAQDNIEGNLPAIGSDGTIYFGSRDNFLYALNSDGGLKWKIHLYGDVGTPVISADGIIFVVTNECYLTAIDSNDVRIVDGITTNGVKWLFDVGLDCTGWGCRSDFRHPVIGEDGTVYLGTDGPFHYSEHYFEGNGRLLAIGTNESADLTAQWQAPPINVRATVNNGTGTINVSWDPPPGNISNYLIERYPTESYEFEGPNGSYEGGWSSGKTDGNLTYFVDSGISTGYIYYYWICTYPSDGSNRSHPSEIVSVVGPYDPSQSRSIVEDPPKDPILFLAPPTSSLRPILEPKEVAIRTTFLIGISVLMGGICGLIFLSSESLSYKLRPFSMVLFTRKRKEEVLDNFLRGQIYGYILENPGINLTDLRKKVVRSNGTVVYHLKTLERDGMIKSYPDGLHRLFFASSMKIPWEFLELTGPQRIIYKLVKENPGISQREIASKTDMSPPKIHRNVHGLASRGFIRIEKNRKTKLYPLQ